MFRQTAALPRDAKISNAGYVVAEAGNLPFTPVVGGPPQDNYGYPVSVKA